MDHQTLLVPASCLRLILEHCRRELPREACGALVGSGNRATRVFPLPNVSPTPTTRYLASPEGLWHVLQLAETAGEELLAIYHSHPHGPPRLSPVDLEQAYWPQLVHIVVSPPYDVRAYIIQGDGPRSIMLISY